MIRVSTRTGHGVGELRQALIEAARQLPGRAKDAPQFRLPIDRAFSPSGQGAVATGTVWQGTARVGDTLTLLPAGTPVRIRRLQSQGIDVESVSAGERAAINLGGIKASDIQRGDELATPHAFEPARRHLVRLQSLPDAVQGVKHRELVRVHLGANQATAQIFMGQRELPPGESAFAVLRCKTPIVAVYGQPFVVRLLSPARTVGGGSFIGPALRPMDRLNRCLEAAPGLSDPDPQVRLEAYIDLRREAEFDEAIESRIGLTRLQCETTGQRLIEQKAVVRTAGPQPRYVTGRRFQKLKQQMMTRCQAELERRRPAWQIPIAVVLSAMSRLASQPVLEAVLDDLIQQGELVRRGDRVGPRAGAELSHRQRGLLDLLLTACMEAGRMPPTLTEFAERNGCTVRDLEPLVQVAVDTGRLDRLSPELAIDHAVLEELRQNLAEYFQQHPSARVSEIREHWGLTRKYAVPISNSSTSGK